MAIEVFNRFEHKYLMGRTEYEKILPVIEQHMVLDPYNPNHTPYTIANIYYDTLDDYLIRKSLSKPIYKEKLRLRSYGVPTLDTNVFLEIKKKCNGIVNKRRTILTLAAAYDFLRTGVPPAAKVCTNKQVAKEIAYFLSFYSLLPKVYLAYDRVAYFEEGNPDLRISFDFNIRSRRHHLALEKGDYGTPLLSDGMCLMEIKTALAKPIWLSDLLTAFHLNRSSFSKYGTEFKQHADAVWHSEKIAI